MSIEQQGASASTSIHPDTYVGMVSLRVSDLERARRFYEGVLGFQPLEQTPEGVILGGQEKRPLLELLEVPGVTPQSRRATGLFHVAILFPTRPDLGRALLRLAKAGVQIGQGDHLVSEALYISDPDGNGLELYQDRPRNTWHWTNSMIEMATDPVDTRSLAEEGARDAEPWETLPVGTRVGHIHLQVGDIPAAEHFYHTVLGFDITAGLPGALFVSAGGYHHHIGLNTWNSQGGKPTPATQAGLQRYMLAVPTREALVAIKERLLAHNIPFEEQGDSIRVNDPWSNEILLTVLPW